MTQQLAVTVPTALRAELARRGISKGVFARRCGHDETWLYRRLNRRTELTLSDLDLMCGELELEPTEFLAIAAAAPAPAPKKTTAGGVSRRRSTQLPSGERNGQ